MSSALKSTSEAEPGSANHSVRLSRCLVFFSLALGGCLVDLLTKHVAFDRLGMPGVARTWWVVEPWFGFRTSLNEGALFGLGQGLVFVFAAASFVAAAFIVYWLFWVGAARDLTLTVALGLVMAGIFGNLYDRLGLHGLKWHFLERHGEPVYAVRDFIQWNFGQFEWPTFNLADSFLVIGAGLLMLHAMFLDSGEKRKAAESA